MAVSLLVADDDDLLRNLVKEVLEDEGYQVYAAADGQETVDIFWEHPEIALVILDIMMPKMDGITVLKNSGPPETISRCCCLRQNPKSMIVSTGWTAAPNLFAPWPPPVAKP